MLLDIFPLQCFSITKAIVFFHLTGFFCWWCTFGWKERKKTDTRQVLPNCFCTLIPIFNFEMLLPTFALESFDFYSQNYKWQNRKLRCQYFLHLKVALPQWRNSGAPSALKQIVHKLSSLDTLFHSVIYNSVILTHCLNIA